MKKNSLRLKIGLSTVAICRPKYINIGQESDKGFSLDAFKQNGKAVLDQA